MNYPVARSIRELKPVPFFSVQHLKEIADSYYKARKECTSEDYYEYRVVYEFLNHIEQK